MRLILYGRRNCHLCDDMARELAALGVVASVTDVDADPALEEKFGDRVPVLVGPDGDEICHGRLDRIALTGMLGSPGA